MVGMSAVVTRDVPPAALAYGNPCRVRGSNQVGMRRAGVSAEAVDAVQSAYAAGDIPDFERDEVLAGVWNWWISQTAGDLA